MGRSDHGWQERLARGLLRTVGRLPGPVQRLLAGAPVVDVVLRRHLVHGIVNATGVGVHARRVLDEAADALRAGLVARVVAHA